MRKETLRHLRAGPLSLAARRGDISHLQELLAAGASVFDVDVLGNTALHYAALGGASAAASVLLRSGAALDPMGQLGMTPLMMACERADLALARLLLDHGADPLAQDAQGISVLVYATATYTRKMAMVTMILAAGGDPNALDRGGEGALHVSARGPDVEVTTAMIDSGACLDVANWKGRTPLMNAAMRGHEPVVRGLLEAGARADLVDREGNTALDLAKSKGRVEVIRLLETWGRPSEP